MVELTPEERAVVEAARDYTALRGAPEYCTEATSLRFEARLRERVKAAYEAMQASYVLRAP